MTITLAAIEVKPFAAKIGAEVKCGDLRDIDDATFKAVHRFSALFARESIIQSADNTTESTRTCKR